MTDPAPDRRTFGTVLLAGVATAGLAAISSSQTWLVARGDAAGTTVSSRIPGSDAAPLALALALVALASWGVILVSGTLARRLATVVGVLSAIGVLVVVVVLWSDTGGVAARVLSAKGARNVTDVSHVGWYWIAGLAALAQVAVHCAAFRLAPSWPTMSSRYDAPGVSSSAATGAAGGGAVPADDLEVWKALDEGRDPTVGPGPAAP